MIPLSPPPARDRHRRCFATFRFAAIPPFELIHLTSGHGRWWRMATAERLTVLLLGLYRTVSNANVANTNVANTNTTTAAQRLHIHREMEPRHDTYGGNFADWPDPGGLEQPI
jgi:hypothetical protein